MTNPGENVPQHSSVEQVESSEGDGVTADAVVPEPTAGQSTDEGTAGGEQITGTELPEGVTPELLKQAGYIADKDYKSLQTEFGTRNDNDKAVQDKFSQFGGLDKAAEMLDYLQGNEEFAGFLKAQQEAKIYGQPVDEVAPETKEAMAIVQRIADERIAENMRTQVDPLANQYKQVLLKENMGKMTEKYPNWAEMKSEMSSIASTLSEQVQDNPSLQDLETLYLRSLVENGKIQDFGKSIYEKELQSAKAKSVNKPTIAKAGVSGQAKTMTEAFAIAKERLNQ